MNKVHDSLAGYYAFVSQILNAKRHPLPEGVKPLAPLPA